VARCLFVFPPPLPGLCGGRGGLGGEGSSAFCPLTPNPSPPQSRGRGEQEEEGRVIVAQPGQASHIFGGPETTDARPSPGALAPRRQYFTSSSFSGRRSLPDVP